jgi:hypothetical protein
MHGFFTVVGMLPGADAAMDFVAAGVEQHPAAVKALSSAFPH